MPSNQNQHSLSIVLPFNKADPLSLASTSACTFTQTVITNLSKLPSKKSSNTSKKANHPKTTLFPPCPQRTVKTAPPCSKPSMFKKKRATLTGDLLPYKKGASSSPLLETTPEDLKSPIPMDSTPNTELQLLARSYFKASKKQKKVSPSVSLSDSAILDNCTSTKSGDHVVSPSSK